MRRNLKIVLVSICLAIGVVALSGLVNRTPEGLVGATWYGLPIVWRYVIITSMYGIVRYDFINFLFDIILWSIPILAMGGLLSLISNHRRK
jgi:hypothetical protein